MSKTTPSLPEFNLTSKVILVSGGARGLGFAQAQSLVEVGAIVHALDIQPEPSEAFQTQQAATPSRLFYHKVDVTDEEAVHATVTKIADSAGRLDGLIAAAGILKGCAAIEYAAADFRRVLDVNITGVFLTAQAAARQMIRFGTGGSIVLVASMCARIANQGVTGTAYNSSKGAVVQMTRNLAAEWGKHGIRVNSISPGYILTDMLSDVIKRVPEREELFKSQNMLGRISKPEEYRGAAVFLLSDASSFMTGSDLIMDGGHHAW